MKKEIFLKKESLDRAIRIFKEKLYQYKSYTLLKEEEVLVYDSINRITSRPVIAKISNPFFNASAVDGFALISSKTTRANISNPKEFVIGVDTIQVNTGDPIFYPYDSVVMIEDAEVNENTIKIFSPLHLYENVRVVGEDFSKGEIVVPVYEKIRPEHIGVLISSYNERIFVFEKPKVLIIATGEEIRRLGEPLKTGDIIDSNSYMVQAILKDYDAEAVIYDEVIPNDFNILREKIDEASHNYHMVVVIGGSAKGTKDLLYEVFKSFSEVIFHGVNIQPGKPLLVAFNREIPLIGLPGFPVSTFIDAKIFLKVALESITGYSLDVPKSITAVVKRDIPSSLGVEEFIRVKVSKIRGEYVCVPLKRGAANLLSVASGDGIIRIEEDKEGIEKGSSVKVELLKSENEVLDQLLFVGSNDPLFEFFLNFLKRKNPMFKFGIVSVGSLGGLLAFAKGETVITSLHLFDGETNTYNTPYLNKYLKQDSYIRVHFANRNQGLIVKKGNPKNIKSIDDLVREDVRFINRQSGSGTRIFLDYLLAQHGIKKEAIKGYEVEEITHLGVANAVLEGVADCGIGIEHVAHIFDLDFIKLGEEEYEIIIAKDYLDDERITLLLNSISNSEFTNIANSFTGYKYVGKIKEADL